MQNMQPKSLFSCFVSPNVCLSKYIRKPNNSPYTNIMSHILVLCQFPVSVYTAQPHSPEKPMPPVGSWWYWGNSVFQLPECFFAYFLPKESMSSKPLKVDDENVLTPQKTICNSIRRLQRLQPVPFAYSGQRLDQSYYRQRKPLS